MPGSSTRAISSRGPGLHLRFRLWIWPPSGSTPALFKLELTVVDHWAVRPFRQSIAEACTPKRSLIIIFTDFIDTTSAELLIENISANCRAMYTKHGKTVRERK